MGTGVGGQVTEAGGFLGFLRPDAASLDGTVNSIGIWYETAGGNME